MERIELQASVREQSGKGPARRLRANKQIPAVLYGSHTDKPVHLAVDPKALREAMATPKRLNTILTLKLGNGGEHTVLLKEFQTEPVSHDLLHVDFVEVRMDKPVSVRVPLAFVGTPAGIKEGGILATPRRELEVKVLPSAIPDSIPVDVSEMNIGDSLHLRDLKLPEGVNVFSRVNFTIALVAAPEKEEVVAAPTEAAAAAAAPGAAPAAGAPAAAPGAAAAPAAGAAAKK